MNKILSLIFVLLLIFTLSSKSVAQDSTASEETTPTPTIVEEIQYELPYPGILPDNTLYFLKALRDNLLGIFISDPVKKADYNLLMADKRLVSSEALLKEGKNELAITTLSKSGNYFDQSIQKINDAKKQGRDVKSFLDRLLTASKKHQQVILEMKDKTKGETRVSLDVLLKRTKGFQDTVEVLKAD
jgi:hypothetical protein